MAIVSFGIACNRKYKDKEETVFVDVTAFGKTGEAINSYLKKGKPIFVEGRLKFDAWEKDGMRNTKLSVVCEKFEFVDSKGSDAESSGGQTQQKFDTKPDSIPEDDIPF